MACTRKKDSISICIKRGWSNDLFIHFLSHHDDIMMTNIFFKVVQSIYIIIILIKLFYKIMGSNKFNELSY